MRCSMSLATACHPASRNPATTGTQESVCSLCGQLHIFSPPCKKKKNSCYKSQASSTPKAIAMWTKGRAGTRAGRAGGGRLGGQASVWVARLSVTQCKKGKRRAARTVAATLATYCVVTSGRRKTQNKFDVVSTTG
uniref:Uncharacterized protein n=1 Tax=Rousettus aegyptiacus TaxID=9407 RepID=A0A7J8D6B8_ROUAE|nr:hypothetical protein HJG63_008752 [Rousettus aegyptiacus]